MPLICLSLNTVIHQMLISSDEFLKESSWRDRHNVQQLFDSLWAHSFVFASCQPACFRQSTNTNQHRPTQTNTDQHRPAQTNTTDSPSTVLPVNVGAFNAPGRQPQDHRSLPCISHNTTVDPSHRRSSTTLLSACFPLSSLSVHKINLSLWWSDKGSAGGKHEKVSYKYLTLYPILHGHQFSPVLRLEAQPAVPLTAIRGSTRDLVPEASMFKCLSAQINMFTAASCRSLIPSSLLYTAHCFIQLTALYYIKA